MKNAWLTVLAAVITLNGAQARETSQATCREYYGRQDPRLFEFVSTRAAIDYAQFEGFNIRSIDYVVLPIFNEDDPRENNALYRLINLLHINTRHKTLKKQLTFSRGDPLNKNALEENERLLRDNDYLVDAMIVPHSVCDNTIDLLVVVRDVWTLSPSASFARAGGENKSDVGISEKNLLGTGQEVALGRFSNSERSGYSVSYSHDQLFNNHSTLDLSYSENSDGNVKQARLARPFYSLNTPWSTGISFLEEGRIEEIRSGDETVNVFRNDIRNYEAFYGWSRGVVDGVARRWTVGLTDARSNFSRVDATSPAPPPDRRLRFPWLSYESIEDRFLTASNISLIGRQEDIPLGARWFARIGYASEDWDSSENAVIYNLSNHYTLSVGKHHLSQTGTALGGRLNTDTGKPVSSVLTLNTRYHHFIDDKNRWFTRLRVDLAKNLNQDEQLTSGGNDNLRGYPNDMQRGNQRWLLTVERRRFTDWHPFQLIRVGGAAYIDVGRTRDTETPNVPSTTTLANAGFGLRLTSSKARTDKVLHLDIAVPLRERDGIDSYQVIVSGKSTF